ncbi:MULTISPECIES: TlyA family rRNA (cytidine-2'-O)-methyltransferase [Brevibacillus]|jgi:23S rRNA (cytidine1920-2'-O)/16S rRNA (cytidine1409-2'-O)-methyltransferase|uniref:TlyA family rRNA (Cytidine-2'-O)-methyltransferase n=1 Tax=Brevibacillus parabrevis TaxID=54914 RepID=A0A4Y3PMI3_BREPA|nr:MULTISPECIES: TlyA family rRNA (cytidine-2'-O)-methyltransferase [Brevibacillus]MDH6349098.1 23S rRNA (cytidine1920-2'-O)/16S rRNA (cytidine1409-2'-O)-methyltransferase [Brevibacillus sp. 1238]MDR5001112.1 TlyA family rRNA (cytidine-2'-O)-methyltransferase [Brevibacillus parabrevis]MED1724092.1 TlyA family rRNA (cytidine-2'-O)-methyltransferase [Brevibacillus parabrevis]NRQ52130.1 TlyA family rRNA (cytidine-2'-O)-methyltransferase [Brevibacillus sp. HD1.4A]RNB93681.1 TlyA family rRNA (cytid
MSVRKERIDVLLVERGHYETREKAKAAVMAGLVQVAGERCDKPGTKFTEDVAITVKGEVHPYVSRGGLKLEKALKVFGIDMTDKVMMDIGASTGGFTDCALQNGARLVYAIDVGYGQLAWTLRQDERVVVMERTNFRHMDPDAFEQERPDAASIDVSFISLRLILPVLYRFLKQDGDVVALVKPQFEAGKDKVGKNGIVREPQVHEAVLTDIGQFASGLGFALKGLDFSPITGGEGNIEFVMHVTKSAGGMNAEEWLKLVSDVVAQAHAKLK